jgi:hypothetical protein
MVATGSTSRRRYRGHDRWVGTRRRCVGCRVGVDMPVMPAASQQTMGDQENRHQPRDQPPLHPFSPSEEPLTGRPQPSRQTTSHTGNLGGTGSLVNSNLARTALLPHRSMKNGGDMPTRIALGAGAERKGTTLRKSHRATLDERERRTCARRPDRHKPTARVVQPCIQVVGMVDRNSALEDPRPWPKAGSRTVAHCVCYATQKSQKQDGAIHPTRDTTGPKGESQIARR